MFNHGYVGCTWYIVTKMHFILFFSYCSSYSQCNVRNHAVHFSFYSFILTLSKEKYKPRKRFVGFVHGVFKLITKRSNERNLNFGNKLNMYVSSDSSRELVFATD